MAGARVMEYGTRPQTAAAAIQNQQNRAGNQMQAAGRPVGGGIPACMKPGPDGALSLRDQARHISLSASCPSEAWQLLRDWASKQPDPAAAMHPALFQVMRHSEDPRFGAILPDVVREASSLRHSMPQQARDNLARMLGDACASRNLAFDSSSLSVGPAAAPAITAQIHAPAPQDFQRFQSSLPASPYQPQPAMPLQAAAHSQAAAPSPSVLPLLNLFQFVVAKDAVLRLNEKLHERLAALGRITAGGAGGGGGVRWQQPAPCEPPPSARTLETPARDEVPARSEIQALRRPPDAVQEVAQLRPAPSSIAKEPYATAMPLVCIPAPLPCPARGGSRYSGPRCVPIPKPGLPRLSHSARRLAKPRPLRQPAITGTSGRIPAPASRHLKRAAERAPAAKVRKNPELSRILLPGRRKTSKQAHGAANRVLTPPARRLPNRETRRSAVLRRRASALRAHPAKAQPPARARASPAAGRKNKQRPAALAKAGFGKKPDAARHGRNAERRMPARAQENERQQKKPAGKKNEKAVLALLLAANAKKRRPGRFPPHRSLGPVSVAPGKRRFSP